MFFILFFSTFLLIQSNINLCKKCKYYIPCFTSYKCGLFRKFNYIKNSTDYEYCFLAREMEEMCGKNGKRFVEKVEKDLFVEKVLSTIWEP